MLNIITHYCVFLYVIPCTSVDYEFFSYAYHAWHINLFIAKLSYSNNRMKDTFLDFCPGLSCMVITQQKLIHHFMSAANMAGLYSLQISHTFHSSQLCSSSNNGCVQAVTCQVLAVYIIDLFMVNFMIGKLQKRFKCLYTKRCKCVYTKEV